MILGVMVLTLIALAVRRAYKTWGQEYEDAD
jgi:hypothetical protein